MSQEHQPPLPFEVAHQVRIKVWTSQRVTRASVLTAVAISLQALGALANPRQPGLISTLAYISGNITSRHHDDLHYWLQGNLFPRLLAILRALPTLTFSPAHTASICSGTAAVLCNIINVARKHSTSMPPWIRVDSMVAQASAPDILAAVVKFGMLCPSALDPAARFEYDLHLEPVAGYIPYAVAAAAAHVPSPGHNFWTHLRVSGHLLATVALGDSAEIDCSSQHLHQVQAVLSQLADERVFLHLLESAVEYTGGRPPLTAARVHFGGTLCRTLVAATTSTLMWLRSTRQPSTPALALAAMQCLQQRPHLLHGPWHMYRSAVLFVATRRSVARCYGVVVSISGMTSVC
jgi:hypothetical protein